MDIVNRDLLKSILRDARDAASAAGDLARDDEIRCLMVDLHLLPRDGTIILRGPQGEVIR